MALKLVTSEISSKILYLVKKVLMLMDNRITNSKNEKFDFKCKKENAINSLLEVEHFLCNLKKLCNTVNLYKILK